MKIVIEFNTGKAECAILRIAGPGTLDVQRLSDDRCFRVTGLDLQLIKYGDLV